MFNYELLLSPKENQQAISRALRHFDDYTVLVVILNSSAEGAFINQCGCEMLGISIDESIGNNWIKHFVPEQQRVEIELGFKQLMLGRTIVYSEYSNGIVTAEQNVRPSNIVTEKSHNPA